MSRVWLKSESLRDKNIFFRSWMAQILHRSVFLWLVVCDNESFLDAKVSEKAYKKCNLELMHVPPRLRRRLRAMDLKDLHAKRKPFGKSALQARVRRVLQTRKAKTVASRIFLGLRKTCQECVNKSGGATKGWRISTCLRLSLAVWKENSLHVTFYTHRNTQGRDESSPNF